MDSEGSAKSTSDGDSDPWEVPNVLSLGSQSFAVFAVQSTNRTMTDGGGIRGLSTLLILKALFKEVAQQDPNVEHDENEDGDVIARPCNYFDHIVGTSTGGLGTITQYINSQGHVLTFPG